ncbi:MAG: DUF2235 domain-containing protein [Candidatus Thiodiazotropha lotti]|nr:DUF2235 domain-containing protein [Candidatus Thiodiazotropha lotti]
MRKIVLFSDGTGNSASSANKTNVWRAYKALDLTGNSGQVAYYDNGVGTSAFTPIAIFGLAFGFGLARNVKQMYRFLCNTYQVGDEIYCFGFSRGAFTIRVLAAMVASEGIINRSNRSEREMQRLVNAAYRHYRKQHFTPSFLSWPLAPLRDLLISLWWKIIKQPAYNPTDNLHHESDFTQKDKSLIDFLGVWDTVDAYGFPISELTRAWDMVVWPLSAKDRDLSPRIARACHALALDEQRKSFEPMLWNETGIPSYERIQDERISQVWFAGVHANVGGGYPDDSLSMVSLDWMLKQCEQTEGQEDGLKFIAAERLLIQQKADTSGPLYDSRAGVGNLYRYAPRDIEHLSNDPKPGLANWLKAKFRGSKLYTGLTPEGMRKKMNQIIALDRVHANEVNIDRIKIHHSVFDRLQRDGCGYSPINIPAKYTYVDNCGQLIEIGSESREAEQLPESSGQAVIRRQHQVYVWNKVWLRKVLYVITLAALLLFITFPYIGESFGTGKEDGVYDFFMPLLGTLGSLVQQIPITIGQIPGLGFAEEWANKYQGYPFVFILGLLFIVGLLFFSLYIRQLIQSQMRSFWHHVTRHGEQRTYVPGPLSQALRNLLGGDRQTGSLGRIIGISTEVVAVIFLLLLVLVAASKTFYSLADATGYLCAEELSAGEKSFNVAFPFDEKNTCFNTGLKMVKGKRYRIMIELGKGKDGNADIWQDGGISADAKGWCQDWCEQSAKYKPAAWWVHLALPLRRHWFADWYQPIARIDNKLLDRYPLEVEEPCSNQRQMTLVTEIKARRSGKLYLYLNDAVVFTPDLIKCIYGNNEGEALVTVEPL